MKDPVCGEGRDATTDCRLWACLWCLCYGQSDGKWAKYWCVCRSGRHVVGWGEKRKSILVSLKLAMGEDKDMQSD